MGNAKCPYRNTCIDKNNEIMEKEKKKRKEKKRKKYMALMSLTKSILKIINQSVPVA